MKLEYIGAKEYKNRKTNCNLKKIDKTLYKMYIKMKQKSIGLNRKSRNYKFFVNIKNTLHNLKK